MANRSESNKNTCLRVSEGWEGDQQPCQSERLTLAAGGSWGWGVAQLLPLGAVLSPACTHLAAEKGRVEAGMPLKAAEPWPLESTLTCLHQTPWN